MSGLHSVSRLLVFAWLVKALWASDNESAERFAAAGMGPWVSAMRNAKAEADTSFKGNEVTFESFPERELPSVIVPVSACHCRGRVTEGQASVIRVTQVLGAAATFGRAGGGSCVGMWALITRPGAPAAVDTSQSTGRVECVPGIPDSWGAPCSHTCVRRLVDGAGGEAGVQSWGGRRRGQGSSRLDGPFVRAAAVQATAMGINTLSS